MKYLKYATTAIALVLSTSVNATLISIDLNTSGDNLITHDSETGLNWLDLTETAGMTYNFVAGQFGTGGQFVGYRHATDEEVVALMANFGIDLSAGAPTSDLNNTDSGVVTATNFLGNVVGDYYTDDSGWYEYGVIGTASGTNIDYPNTHSRLGAYWWSPSSTSYATVGIQGYEDDYARGVFGHWLVETTVVPVPAAAWLFGSGLIGLIGVARRKARA